MGRRFFFALLSTFLLTAMLLGGAGYAVTRIAVPKSRDIFRAGFFDFELAPGWWCEHEEEVTEYVCMPPGGPPHTAIAIIAMKERSKFDNLAAYEAHLRQPQQPVDKPSAKKSEIRSLSREIFVGRHEWVTSLHSGSEIENFDTYYLATATSHLGILVTMSVHKDHTQEYIEQINRMMKTLSIYQR